MEDTRSKHKMHRSSIPFEYLKHGQDVVTSAHFEAMLYLQKNREYWLKKRHKHIFKLKAVV